MTIVLIDTSVFCNIVPVPGRDQNREEVMNKLTDYITDNATLLLPMTAVLETGNHVAQIPNGHKRRATATEFCKQVRDAIQGSAPWTPTPFWEPELLDEWLMEFPQYALGGKGIGDLSIVKEWERQISLNKSRRILIWSFDGHLASYDKRS
jgi:hypothetical protein